MKEMYNNYDEEEEDWDKPEVNMLSTGVHSLSPFFTQKIYTCIWVFLPLGKLDVADFVCKPEVNSGQNPLFWSHFTKKHKISYTFTLGTYTVSKVSDLI